MTTKRHIRSAVLLFFFIFALAATSASAQTDEFRGVWVSAWDIGFKSPTETSNLVAHVRTGNCNAILMQVRRRGDAYYTKSPYEPQGEFAERFDPLADVVEKAHDRKSGPRVEVHAWFVVYPLATVRDGQGPANPKHPYNLHRDWLDQSEKSDVVHDISCSLDPGHPAAQEYLFNVAMDIISHYKIDGFHFDHNRYPNRSWGYNPVSVERFNKLYHRSGKPKPDDPEWGQFRRAQVTALIRKIYLSAIAIKPEIKISASTITWPPCPQSDSQWTNTMAYKDIMHDWKGWVEEGILDMNILMNFYRQSVSEDAKTFADWNDFAKDHRYNRHLIIGTGNWLNNIQNGISQMQSTRQASPAGNKADGLCLYAYAPPSSEQISQEKYFKVLGSRSVQKKPPLFAQPASIPDMSWKSKPKTGHLKGFVSGEDKTNKLDGATIFLDGPIKRKLISDGTGFYGAADLLPGEYKISASYEGHAGKTNRIKIAAGKVRTTNLKLQPVKK